MGNKKATSLSQNVDSVARELESEAKLRQAHKKIDELRRYNAELRSLMICMGKAADAAYQAAEDLGEVP